MDPDVQRVSVYDPLPSGAPPDNTAGELSSLCSSSCWVGLAAISSMILFLSTLSATHRAKYDRRVLGGSNFLAAAMYRTASFHRLRGSSPFGQGAGESGNPQPFTTSCLFEPVPEPFESLCPTMRPQGVVRMDPCRHMTE